MEGEGGKKLYAWSQVIYGGMPKRHIDAAVTAISQTEMTNILIMRSSSRFVFFAIGFFVGIAVCGLALLIYLEKETTGNIEKETPRNVVLQHVSEIEECEQSAWKAYSSGPQSAAMSALSNYLSKVDQIYGRATKDREYYFYEFRGHARLLCIAQKNNANALMAEHLRLAIDFMIMWSHDSSTNLNRVIELIEKIDQQERSAQYYLELRLQNNSGGEIDEAAIVFAKDRFTFGVLPNSITKDCLNWEKPVGTNATVQWRDSQATKKEFLVDLSKEYDPHVEGRLIFTIESTNVTVKFVAIDRK